MLQPNSERDLEKLSFTVYGPYSVLSPGLDLMQKQPNDLSRTMEPALREMSNQLSLNVDLMSTYGPNVNSPYRNELQTEHDLNVASRLSGSTLNLFYTSWSRLLREITRRLFNGEDDVFTKRLLKRLENRGVTKDMIKEIDFDNTSAVRAIGSGSQANRMLALRDLNQFAGAFDETGRKNLIRDIVASRVGHDLVDRYVPMQMEPRTTIHSKLAMLENGALDTGAEVPVMSDEPHIEHLSVQAPKLNELIAMIQQGQGELGPLLSQAMAYQKHIGQHAEYLAADPTASAEVAELKRMMQISTEVITNFGRRFDRMMREQAAAGGQEAEGQAQLNPVQLKLQEHELRMQITRDKAELEKQIRQSKAEQDLAIKDAERSLRLLERGRI